MIPAGTIWEYWGETFEFVEDLNVGDHFVVDKFLVNGEKPTVGERLPDWVCERLGI